MRIKGLQNKDQRIILVGGAFDLLHLGHVKLFKYAKSLRGKVVVAVLSDKYVRSYKGVGRPFIRQKERLQLVKSLKYVDLAFTVNEDPYTKKFIGRVRPRVIVIGEEAGKQHAKKARAALLKKQFPDLKVYFLKRYRPQKVSTTHLAAKIARST